MSFYRDFSENEGLHLTGNNTLDIIVRKVGGTKRCREVDLEIIGVECQTVHLSQDNAYDLSNIYHLADDLSVRIWSNFVHPSNKVRLEFNSKEYEYEQREY